VKLTKVVNGWLWHSGMIGNRSELGLGYFSRLIVGNVKYKMENIAGGGEPIA
jgi:hypothetical protein